MTEAIIRVFEGLLGLYGKQGWWPITPQGKLKPEYHISLEDERQRLEIILGAILTQNTSWKNAEKAITNLNSESMLDRRSLEKASVEEIAELIRPAGYFNQKTKKIKAYLSMVPENTEPSREELLKVWGIGPETADSILLYAYGKPEFVVDAYTERMLREYGLISDTRYEEIKKRIQEPLEKHFPARELVDVFKEFHALIVEHGKNHYSRKPYGISDPLKISLQKEKYL